MKIEQDASCAVHKSHQVGPAHARSVIRARATIRGFKDVLARNFAYYAGTSQCYGPTVFEFVVVRNQWDICTTDISKACLHTYKELAAAIRGPVRGVNLVHPAYCVVFLRGNGYAHFDPIR